MKSKFDIDKLKELCADLYELTRTKVTIYDTDYSIITSYPMKNCTYCQIIRRNPDLAARCAESDRSACQICSRISTPYSYVCHAGLMEVMVAIKMNNIVLGFVSFGQMADSDSRNEQRERAFSICDEYGFDETELMRAFDRVVCKTIKQIRSASKIVESCTAYMWISGQVKLVETTVIFQLISYIDQHLTDDLSVENLCRVFHVSRSRLYSITEEHLGMGIAAYIRSARIKHAKSCLDMNMSVAETAQSAGFDDYNYFSKVFKRETGLYPTEYKKSSK